MIDQRVALHLSKNFTSIIVPLGILIVLLFSAGWNWPATGLVVFAVVLSVIKARLVLGSDAKTPNP